MTVLVVLLVPDRFVALRAVAAGERAHAAGDHHAVAGADARRRSITAVTTSWQHAFDVIKRGHEHRDVPFKLASGQTSQHYIDGKHAVDTGARLAVVSQAVVDLAAENKIEFDAVGDLTMGADALAHGVAMVTGKAWFSVRKEPKSRGLEQFIEGFRLRDHPGTRVLLVEDVVEHGGSVRKAYDRSIEAGAVVTGVIPMVDRGEVAARTFADLLGIEPITES